eukprot:10714820-Alexandrium_andersonii.AAC.1
MSQQKYGRAESAPNASRCARALRQQAAMTKVPHADGQPVRLNHAAPAMSGPPVRRTMLCCGNWRCRARECPSAE